MNKADLMTAGAMLGILLTALAQASANPVTIDAERRPVRMIAEDVTISVGPKVSLVKGVYRFQQLPDDRPGKKDKHVVVFVPWFVSDRDVPGTSAPVVKVQGVSIPPREWNDLPLADDPSEMWERLQKGFSFRARQYVVPLERIGKTFELTVEYSQANFPGHVAAYLPIDPPAKAGAGRVTFVAQPGYALKPYAARSFWNPGFSSLAYVPKNRELLRVKCVRKGEGNH